MPKLILFIAAAERELAIFEGKFFRYRRALAAQDVKFAERGQIFDGVERHDVRRRPCACDGSIFLDLLTRLQTLDVLARVKCVADAVVARIA